MKLCDAAKRIGSFLISICIILGGFVFFAAALEEAAPLGVSILGASYSFFAVSPACETAAQLQQLVEENDGGVVALTGNVVVDEYCILEAQNPTTIEMGAYGITVTDGQDAYLDLWGPLHFVGEGTRQPLFSLQTSTESDLLLYSGGDATFTATGANATAVEAWSNVFLGWLDITATGENSVAIRAGGKAEFRESTIRASGDGGTAIHAVRGVHVYDSDISAAGTAIISDKGRIFVDYASVSPMPAGAEIVERYAAPYNGYPLTRYGICAAEGREPSLPEEILFNFIDKNNRFNTMGASLPVEWSGFDFENATVGEYKLSLTSDGIPQRFANMEGLGATEIPLHIVDPAKPFLAGAFYMAETTYSINFFRPIENADEMILWHSVDEGKSWSKRDEYVNPWCATISFEDDQIYWLRLEVIGGPMAGISNILQVWYDPVDNPGGDRGVDWDDDMPIPPLTLTPPPDPPPTEPPLTNPPPAEPPGTASGRDSGGGGSDRMDSDPTEPDFAAVPKQAVPEKIPEIPQAPHENNAVENTTIPEAITSPPQAVNAVPEQQTSAPLPEPDAVAPEQPAALLPEPVPIESSRTWALVTGSVAACGAGGFAASHFLLRRRP